MNSILRKKYGTGPYKFPNAGEIFFKRHFCLYSQTKRFFHEGGRTEAVGIMQRRWKSGLWAGRRENMKNIKTIASHSRFERKETGWQRLIGLHKELERKLMPVC